MDEQVVGKGQDAAQPRHEQGASESSQAREAEAQAVTGLEGVLEEDALYDSERPQELSDYEKGYLDGLLEGTRSAPSGMTWAEAYKQRAEKYLASIGLKGWKVNARHV